MNSDNEIDPQKLKDHDPAKDGATMMAQVTEAFRLPLPHKPLSKKSGGAKHSPGSKGRSFHHSRGSKRKGYPMNQSWGWD